MKASRPRFLTERLSVVCTWTGLTPIPNVNLKASKPVVLDHSEQELLQELSELEKCCNELLVQNR